MFSGAIFWGTGTFSGEKFHSKKGCLLSQGGLERVLEIIIETFQFFCKEEATMDKEETIPINSRGDTISISSEAKRSEVDKRGEPEKENHIEKQIRVETGEHFSLLEVNTIEALACFTDDLLHIALQSRCLSKEQAFYFSSFLNYTIEQEAMERKNTLICINNWFETAKEERKKITGAFAEKISSKKSEKEDACEILEQLFTYNHTFIKAYCHLFIKVISAR